MHFNRRVTMATFQDRKTCMLPSPPPKIMQNYIIFCTSPWGVTPKPTGKLVTEQIKLATHSWIFCSVIAIVRVHMYSEPQLHISRPIILKWLNQLENVKISYLYMRPSVFPASCFSPSLLGTKPGSLGVSMSKCDNPSFFPR